MIVDKRFHLGEMAASSAPTLAVLIAYDIVITVVYSHLDWHFVSLPNIPLSLLGSAIALIVTIRNNAAYGRWWEARRAGMVDTVSAAAIDRTIGAGAVPTPMAARNGILM